MDINKQVDTLALKHKTEGFHPDVDNLPPSTAEIIIKIKNICNV